jgi:gliding motility-associated lipoprotein GldH
MKSQGMRGAIVLFFAIALSFLSGCTETGEISANVYEVTDAVWFENQAFTHEFAVVDGGKTLNINLNVRVNKDYSYSNIYIKGTVLDSSGKEIKSELKEILLYHTATGKPLGSGFGDINEVKASLFKGLVLTKPMKYKLVLKQYMREKRLAGVESVGVQILQP